MPNAKAAIAAGVATFAFGMSLAHLARAWLVRRYLPVTDWDAGVRNSVSTGVAYLGVAIALACGLAVTGLGFQQIALIASALSVGIGFGLQQVVQNFVAGIILLIERPVKVGDRVNVGGVEGDVLKIRVRATEIRGTDWSTIIVPNSNLITTNVQNRTPPDPRARIQLQVKVARPADVKKARDAILKLVEARTDVLQQPTPQVYIDGLADGGGASLSCWIHLASAREATAIKSELYFEILDAFQEGSIALL
jgi:small-conductance mechanosensitive channel